MGPRPVAMEIHLQLGQDLSRKQTTVMQCITIDLISKITNDQTAMALTLNISKRSSKNSMQHKNFIRIRQETFQKTAFESDRKHTQR